MAFLALGSLMALWALWHCSFYWHQRRWRIGDLQPLFYPASSLFSVTLLRLQPGQELLSCIDQLRRKLDSVPGVQVIYVGQVMWTPIRSSQLPRQWDAVLIACHPSRKAFERLAADRYHRWLQCFDDYHIHGFHRPILRNDLSPLILWGLRHYDRLRKRPSHFPFASAQSSQNRPNWRAEVNEADRSRLDKLREHATKAVVVVNLTRVGDPAQRKANAQYQRAMMHLMAEGRHGPTHLGIAVNFNDTQFDHVAAVYYPGIDYFRSMVYSQFYAEVEQLKQFDDGLALLTAPLLNRL